MIYDIEVNLIVDYDLSIFFVESCVDFLDGLMIIVLIYVLGIWFGFLIIWCNDKKFEDEDLIFVEIVSIVVGI